MIKTISSALFAFYTLSSAENSRLLLQGPPTFVNAQPEPATPAEPAQPAAPGVVIVDPAAPVEFVPAAPAEPAAPAQPAVPAEPTTPPFIPVVLPNAGLGPMLEMYCNVDYLTPGTCAGTIKEVTNPPMNMKIECNSLGGCAQTQLTFNLGPSHSGQRIGVLSFSEQYSGFGAIVRVDNQSPVSGFYVDRIECKAPGACQDMVIELIDADLNDLECDRTKGYCNGCVVKKGKRENPLTPDIILWEADKACGFY